MSNIVLPADDKDFSDFKELCQSTDKWVLGYNKKKTRVYTKAHPDSNIKLLKAIVSFEDINAATVFDVVHDTDYRKKWDHDMLSMEEICKVSVNNTVSYYAAKCPTPIKSRDVVFLSSWIAYPSMREPKEYIMINRSVSHTEYPPKKNMVRAISINTGYMITPTGPHSCDFVYLTQFDPRGSIPKWVVNTISEVFLPKAITRIHKASRKYPEWKSKHNAGYKPWLFPEQCSLPAPKYGQLSSRADKVDIIDESEVTKKENEDYDSLDEKSDNEN